MIDEQRKAKMIEMRQNHTTLSDIGKEFGLTRQRVQAIIGKTGYVKIKKEYIHKRDNIVSRFFQYVTLPGGDLLDIEMVDFDSCWIWHGSKMGKGYGQTHYPPGIQSYAHRFAYQLFNGPITDGMEVCHSCDNPACVNPAHLWLGTHHDNIMDSVKKGRWNKNRKRRIALRSFGTA